MKKLIVTLALLLIATLLFSACGALDSLIPSNPPTDDTAPNTPADQPDDPPEDQPEDQPDNQYEDLKRKLAGDWSMYLTRKEKMCADMYWMIDYIERFYENPTWETLARARVALGAVRSEIEALSMPTYSIPVEKHAQLISAGYDITGMWEELHRLESIQAEWLSYCDALIGELYSNIFFTPLYECSKEYTGYVKTTVDIERELTACDTDKLMLVMNSETLSNDFMAYLKENTPLLVEYLPEFSSDLTAIEQRANATLDKMEASINLLNVIYGKQSVAVDQFYEVYSDLDQFDALMLRLPGEGYALPLPSFLDFTKVKEASVLYMDENDDVHYASVGEEITFTPNTYYLEFAGVTKDYYDAYRLYLDAIGVTCMESVETATGGKAYYLIDQEYVIVILENGNLTIEVMGQAIYPIAWFYSE